MTVTQTRAELSAAEINDLPDSAFAYIEPGGTKDSGGKTVPRSKRHFPVHDKAHVQNALARMGTSPFGDKAKPAILAAARKFGIDVSEHESSRTPLETLRRRRGSMVHRLERRGLLLEMRARPDGSGGTEFVFEGYGATFDQPFEMWDFWGDPYTEVVRPGAFARSLAASPDVPFLIGHNDQGIPLARTRNGTMQLAEDSRGLHVRAVMDGGRSDVRTLASAVERGDLDEMSIGFVTVTQEWSPDWQTRAMLDLELHRGDVSAVALAANAGTAGVTMTALPAGSLSRRAASHGPYTGTHTHAHPAFGSQGGDATHEHEHTHDGDADHDHMHPEAGPNDRSGRRPGDRRAARGEIDDSSNQPDFNLATDDPASNGAQAVKCPYTRKNGCGQMCPGGSRFCGSCGGPLYDGDGLMVLDDSGVVEEAGDMADADLLARRLRLLELT